MATSSSCAINSTDNTNTPDADHQESDPREELAAGPPELVLPRGETLDPISGNLLVIDWGDLTQGIDMRPGDRFQWPDSHQRYDHSEFQVLSTVQPYWIQVNLFAAINTETGMPIDPQTGQPTELPIYEYECQGFEGERGCPAVQDGVATIDALPASPMPNEFVTVFVAWTVPFTQEELAADPSVTGRRVFASWMFHFAND